MTNDRYIRFTVKVLPPTREKEGATSPSEEPLRSLAIGAKPRETFADLRRKIEIRAGALAKQGSERKGRLGQLQHSSGADVFGEDEVGSLYDELPFGQQHTLFARLEASHAEHVMAGTSIGAQQSSKRRASDEGLNQERGSSKRRKLAADEEDGLRGSRRPVVADSFKIPAMRAPNAVGGEFGSSATVLVKDSQPEEETARGELNIRKAHLRKPHNTSSPAPRSSPLLAAATRDQALQNAGAQSAGTRKALPTPESRDRKRAHIADDTPGQSMAEGATMSSWFKRQTPTSKSALDHVVEQEDLIEDAELDANDSRLAVEKTVAGRREPTSGAPNDRSHGHLAPDDNQSGPKVALNALANKTVRTPSMHHSRSTQTRDSYAPSSSQNDTIKNTARSIAHGWTKEEDDALLEGLSRKGMKVEDILKEYKIDRTVSAARSRKALLLSNRKSQQNNKLNFPSSSLAIPLSESEDEPSQSAKSRVSRWSQSDIGTLRKAIGDGMNPREIRLQLFGGRSEEAVNAKIRKIEPSVIKLEKSKSSFPRDAISWHQWTDAHTLKLRRAYREGLNVVAAGSRYFKGLPKNLVESKMKAYRQQMEDLVIEQELSQSSKPVPAENPRDATDGMANREAGVDASLQQPVDADQDDAPPSHDDLDAEILRELDGDGEEDEGPVIQDSYETGSVNIASSPPLVRKVSRQLSPRIIIPPAEQLEARREQHGNPTVQTAPVPLLRRSTSSKGQMQLNFQREKGKGAVRPPVDLEQLNRQYGRQAPHSFFPQAMSSAAHVDAAVVSVEYENSDAYSSKPKAGKHVQHCASDSLDSDGTVSSGAPNRQLAFELEQSLSATEPSTQSQAAQAQRDGSATPLTSPAVKQPTAYVYIPSPNRPAAASNSQMNQGHHSEESEPTPLAQDNGIGVSQQQKSTRSSPKSMMKLSKAERMQRASDASDSEPAFQTQDPKTIPSQKQKVQDSTSRPKLRTQNGIQAQGSSRFDGESPAFQTQDPSTTLSQKRDSKPQSTAEPVRKASSMLRDAVNLYEASQNDAEATTSLPSPAEPKPAVLSRPRRNVYDVPVSSQSAGDSQNLRRGRSTPQAPTSSEKRAPGQLPRIIGSASRLHMRRKEQEAQIAARRAERKARSAAQTSSVTPPSHQGRGADTIASNDDSVSTHVRPDGLANESGPHMEQAETDQPRLDQPLEAVAPAHPTSTADKTLADAEVDMDNEADADAEVDVDDAFGETSQSKVQVQPVVGLPYPQVLSREPGPNGKIEVGRPGLSFKVPPDCAYLRDEDQLLAAASKHTSDPRAIKHLAQDMKLADQQAIAIACEDHDKLKDLHKQERRYRRERRVEEGLPPSRGPAPRFLQPGEPMGIQWDVNVMPDSDDSMSSRGRDMDDGDEMPEEEHSEDDELNGNDNPAYFDRSRHFSEVEDDSDEEHVEPTQRLITEAENNAGERSNEGERGDNLEGVEATQVHAHEDEIIDEASHAGKLEESLASPPDVTEHSAAPSGVQAQGLDPVEDSMVVDEPIDAHQASESAGASALGLISGSAAEAPESNDEAELPTAPPPIPDSIEDGVDVAPAPSDRELQDLVQSGDDEMHAAPDAPPLPATRLSPGLGSSPVNPSALQETQNNHTIVDNSFATTNFSPVNTRRSDEGTVEYWQRRNASPNRHPSITDSMLPPWPSSGKVRSSLEAPATQTPPVASEDGSNMADEKLHKHAASSRTDKKRKSDMTADELAQHRGSRSAKKARREEKKKKDAEKQLPADESVANGPLAEKQHTEVNNHVIKSAVPPNPGVPLTANETSNSRSRKNKKKKKQTHPKTPENGKNGADQLPSSKQVEQKDRIAMPPPAVPFQHVHLAQQSSLPSPDSEFSMKARKSEKQAKKRAKKRAKREARRSSMSASVQDSTTSDTSFALPVASSPPVLEKSTQTAAQTATQQPAAEGSPVASVDEPAKPKKTKKSRKHSNDAAVDTVEAFIETTAQNKADLPAPEAASKSAVRSQSRATSEVRPRSSHKKKVKSSSQGSLPKTEEKKVKSIKQAGAASASSNTPPAKAAKLEPAPNKGQQVEEMSVPKGNGAQSQAGASGGLKKLMCFQPHIPDAPKPLSPAAKGAAKARLIDDDTDEDGSESSSSSE